MEAWRSNGWPGFIDGEGSKALRWARLAHTAGEGVADAAYSFECTTGNEEIVAEMAATALGYLRRLDRSASKKGGEA